MEPVDIFDLIERMAALIRAEERKVCTELGLRPVHVQVLDYLAQCNRFSDTPGALTNYLGMTRGTVSQTLLLLEKKGLVLKTIDPNDRRMVHLKLSNEGESVLNQAKSAELFKQASEIFKSTSFIDQAEVFANALTALQKANQSQTFGLCQTCKHFNTLADGYFCGLTKERLSKSDSEKICQEHTLF